MFSMVRDPLGDSRVSIMIDDNKQHSATPSPDRSSSSTELKKGGEDPSKKCIKRPPTGKSLTPNSYVIAEASKENVRMPPAPPSPALPIEQKQSIKILTADSRIALGAGMTLNASPSDDLFFEFRQHLEQEHLARNKLTPNSTKSSSASSIIKTSASTPSSTTSTSKQVNPTMFGGFATAALTTTSTPSSADEEEPTMLMEKELSRISEVSRSGLPLSKVRHEDYASSASNKSDGEDGGVSVDCVEEIKQQHDDLELFLSKVENTTGICKYLLIGKCRKYKHGVSYCKFSHSIDKCIYCQEKLPDDSKAMSKHLLWCARNHFPGAFANSKNPLAKQ